MKLFTIFLKKLKSLLLPHICINCKKETQDFMCQVCRDSLEGSITLTHESNKKNVHFILLASYANTSMRSLIFLLKKKQSKKAFQLLDILFSRTISHYLFHHLSKEKPFILVSVPSHHKTTQTVSFPLLSLFFRKKISPLFIYIQSFLKQKGFTHSVLLLKRLHTTKKQGLLSVIERKKNQTQSMSLPDDLSCLKKNNDPTPILIIDDVITTGSTIKESIRVLRTQFKKNPIFIIVFTYGGTFQIKALDDV